MKRPYKVVTTVVEGFLPSRGRRVVLASYASYESACAGALRHYPYYDGVSVVVDGRVLRPDYVAGYCQKQE